VTNVAQDQVARLLALLPYLLHHPGARLADVAATFGVSEQQLVADLNVLWFSGLPGHAMGDYIEVDMEAVEGEGVVRVSNADYLARPLRLAPDEATALLTALRVLAALPGTPQQDADAVARVTAKLEQAAGAAAERASAMRVEVQGDPIEATAATVRQALARGRRLHLAYWNLGRDETTERDVDPMRLLVVDGRLYLEGWCRRVESVRLFRLDRVVDVTVLDVPAEVPEQATPRDLSAGLFQPSPDDLVVTVDLGPWARWVTEAYPIESVEPLPAGAGATGGPLGAAGALRVRLRASDPAWVVRLALRLGPTARVVGPPDVVAAVRAAAGAALAAAGPATQPPT
jgi:proteasome accessory factor C